MVDDKGTKTVPARDLRRVGRWRIEVTSGPDRGARAHLTGGVFRIGTASSSDLALADGMVSRHHLEVTVRPSGLHVRDAGSKNGTFYQGSRVDSLELPLGGGALRIGDTELALMPDDEPPAAAAPPPRERCARLIGRNPRMQQLFALIERLARHDTTVLIEGETGTGKDLVAEALHELGPHPDGPFVVVDCGAIPRELLESELYGHVRGAFTGAVSDAEGAFQRAQGGTLFLDEIGELPLELQPKLLRALERREIRRVGTSEPTRVQLRILAATNRDLGADVASGRFRKDLFYRLSVVRLHLPRLRDRAEDVPLIADQLLRELGAPPLGADTVRLLTSYAWPGNVRQLRNVLERAVALSAGGSLAIEAADLEAASALVSPSTLLSLPYKQAKEEMLARFTRDYLESLLARHGGNVSAAAREAHIDRNWIVALARRYGVVVRE
jgi:DNA-binding NtrC family response regulator